MKNKKHFSIRKKLLIVFGLLIILGGVIQGSVSWYTFRKTMIKDVEERLTDKAANIAILEGHPVQGGFCRSFSLLLCPLHGLRSLFGERSGTHAELDVHLQFGQYSGCHVNGPAFRRPPEGLDNPLAVEGPADGVKTVWLAVVLPQRMLAIEDAALSGYRFPGPFLHVVAGWLPVLRPLMGFPTRPRNGAATRDGASLQRLGYITPHCRRTSKQSAGGSNPPWRTRVFNRL